VSTPATGQALKAAEGRAKKTKAQRKLLDRLFVEDSEYTADELKGLHRQRKAEFYEREARRAAA
jgi:hypothetical protein